MAARTRRWTVDEVLAVNEWCATRLEVIDGELLRPEGTPPDWEAALEGLVSELRVMGSVSTRQ